MKRNARVLGIAVATLGAVACLLGITLAQPAANEVVQWNETAMKAIEANGQNPVQSTRTLAMVQGAVHDALNAINRRYDAYYFEGPADAAGSPDAAVEGRGACPRGAGIHDIACPRHRRPRPEQGGGRRPGRGGGDADSPQG